MPNRFRAVPLALILMSWSAISAELPDTFPDDIPVADFMTVVSTMQVREELMVDFHAPGQTMDGVAEWLIAAMTGAGWENTDNTGSSRSRILVFFKGERRCGMMVTNFVMSPGMQMDETTKGIQMQISGGGDTDGDGPSATSSIDAAAENQ